MSTKITTGTNVQVTATQPACMEGLTGTITRIDDKGRAFVTLDEDSTRRLRFHPRNTGFGYDPNEVKNFTLPGLPPEDLTHQP